MNDFSERIARLHPSPIRDILHVLERPGMISFAGGLPSAESFPQIPFNSVPASQLQYGASEGDTALREKVAAELSELGLDTAANRVLILSGSQQGIDLVAKLFIDRGTPVAVESPTYLAALQVFSLFGAHYVPYHPASPQTLLSGPPPAFAYSIPTFQNPTGHCYTASQRATLAHSCDQAGITLFEDDPYRELAYDDCDRVPVCASMQSSDWIYQSSFSKTMAPGLRLGYLTASERLFPHLVRLKQAADLHSSRVGQSMALTLLDSKDRHARIERVIQQYRKKRNDFDYALQQHFGDIADWKPPQGGLFFWLNLRCEKSIDTQLLLQKSLEQNVAFMPGEPFYPDNGCQDTGYSGNGPTEGRNTIRLNFSLATAAQMDQGLATLAALVRKQF